MLLWLAGSVLLVGLLLWALGVAWGSAVAGLGLVLFVIAAWLGTRPADVRVPPLEEYRFGCPPRVEPPHE
jgi:hypothetical protein